jgi:hypothetical protein
MLLSSPGRSFTRRQGIKFAFSAVLARYAWGQTSSGLAPNIPPRSPQALTGSQFAETIANIDRKERENAILGQLLSGNLPDFLRRPVPIRMVHRATNLTATIFVMPEYLAIGSDSDFLRIPMNLHTARAVAERFNCLLPTRKIVDSVYAESANRLTPQPLPAGPQMTSTAYYRTHNGMIDQQAETRRIPVGPLISGHKKDVVLTNLLARRPGQIAIYGWHRGVGAPIQPLSTVHGATYADYSHGIRLVSKMAVVDNQHRSLSEIMQDPALANIVSDEGSLRPVLDAWSRQPARAS